MSSQSDTKLFVGLDIGGTKCAVVVGNSVGEVVGRIEHPTARGLDTWPAAGATLLGLIHSLLGNLNLKLDSIAAIGVSSGGPINISTGTILSPPNLLGWTNVNIRAFLLDAFYGPRVLIENDANATAIAEHRWGAAKGVNHFAYLTCGTGIGAGIILNGQIFRGKADLAGEIGHAVVIPGGPICLCGKRGCLETVASGGAIGRIGSEVFGTAGMTGQAVIELAKSGNREAEAIVRDAAYYLGIGIANLLQTLDLQKVILGSLAVYAGPSYLDVIRQTVQENTWQDILNGAEILPSGLSTRTQDLAALAVAMSW